MPTPPFWLHSAMTRAGPCAVERRRLREVDLGTQGGVQHDLGLGRRLGLDGHVHDRLGALDGRELRLCCLGDRLGAVDDGGIDLLAHDPDPRVPVICRLTHKQTRL